jgi:WD40 repeat protein
LVGHTEGITYVSAKGDGRYVISNGKDQALRLWDLRKMRSSEEFDEIGTNRYGIHDYDYRSVIQPVSWLANTELILDKAIIPGHEFWRIRKIAVS